MLWGSLNGFWADGQTLDLTSLLGTEASSESTRLHIFSSQKVPSAKWVTVIVATEFACCERTKEAPSPSDSKIVRTKVRPYDLE